DPEACEGEELPVWAPAALACQPFGAGCPSPDQPLGEPLPGELTNTAYVLPGAEDGDGTYERPYGSIEEAAATGVPRLRLGLGEYGHVLLPGAIELWGVCRDGVVLRTFGSEDGFT